MRILEAVCVWGLTSAGETARAARGSLRALYHRGDRYRDPICEGQFRSLMPTPWSGRPNAYCPRCGSLERHRLEWLFLVRELDLLTARYRVLHVAPERGVRDRLRGLDALTYVTTDRFDPAVSVRADIAQLPFRDESFDLVLCNHVLEHVSDDRAAMREMRRVLVPGGRAVMQHPIDTSRPTTFEDPSIVSPEERDEAYFQHDHMRRYGTDFADRLAESGFSDVTCIRYGERLPVEERDRYRLDPMRSPRPERDLELDAIYVALP